MSQSLASRSPLAATLCQELSRKLVEAAAGAGDRSVVVTKEQLASEPPPRDVKAYGPATPVDAV